MHDLALEIGHPRPFGGVALRVIVIALAHPEEVRRECQHVPGLKVFRLDGPLLLRARPARRADLVAIADMLGQTGFLDHFAHVFEDLFPARNRWADPWLEAVAEGVEIGVRADARIAVHVPGAAKALIGLEHHEFLLRRLRLEVIGRADAGNARAGDQHIEMLDLCLGFALFDRCGIRHAFLPGPRLW